MISIADELPALETPPLNRIEDIDQLGVPTDEHGGTQLVLERLRERFPTGEMTFKAIGDGEEITNPARRQVLELAAEGKTLAAVSLEVRRPLYDTALLLAGLLDEGRLQVGTIEADVEETDPVGMIATLLAAAEMRLKEERFDSALDAYERVLALDGVNQAVACLNLTKAICT